ncbi:MAG: amidinotransferase [Oligoflexia bacterium]|nr:amidinotransferase [Oligoflexia bacterium]
MVPQSLFPNGRWLLCEPKYFDVTYEINPWMSLKRTPERTRAQQQWQALHHTLIRLGAWVEYVDPLPKQPDMVFTANAGLVIGKRCILTRFKHAERQGEEAGYRTWFEQQGYEVVVAKSGFFEGEGDALFAGTTLFVGCGFRTDPAVEGELKQLSGAKELVMCELSNSYFYHLDTCFCPLDAERALVYPGAFSSTSLARMAKYIRLIEIPEADARRFACNMVPLGKRVVVPAGCSATYELLAKEGFEAAPVELDEYMKAGGAAKCLCLRL